MGFLSDLWDWIEDKIDQVLGFVGQIWDEIVMPILEEVFSWFGIVDYLVVTVQKISQPIYQDAVDDAYDAAIVKAILKMPKNDAGFFRNYMQEVNLPRAQMKGYFRSGELGNYINGLPTMVIKGKNMDYVAIQDAVEDDLASAPQIILSADSTFPDDETWFQWYLQENYSYLPYDNTLTYPDQNGTNQADWVLDSIVYQSGTDDYDLNISRDVDETKLWITGPTALHEGDTGTYRIHINRTQPVATNLIVNLAYTGTAVDGTDYTEIASATILAGTTFIDFDIVTIGDVISETLNFTVSIDSWDNTDLGHDHITIYGLGEVTTEIKDDEGLVLTIAETFVDETAGTVNVPITLENAAAGAFVVTATTVNGTAISPADYTHTATGLNFSGAAGQTVNFSVPITNDAENDDNQYFEVHLSGCTDPLVDQSQTGTVWIRDYTDVDPPAVVINDTATITQPNYVSERHLIVTRRGPGDPVNEWYWWLYRFADGTYPNVAPTGSGITNLDIMPIAILRRDKQFITAPSTLYDSVRLLTAKLGLRVDDIIDNLAENPDINIIESCYINFAVSPMDYKPFISHILYSFFRVIVVDYAVTSNSNKYSGNLTEQDVNNSLVWTKHTYSADISGTVTTVGSYTHDIYDGNDGAGSCKVLRMRHQHTAGLYDEIQVYRMNSMSAIHYGDHHQMAVSTLDGIDESFTIPVSWLTLEELSTKEQVQAYPYMLRLDMYAIQITEMEWYKSEAFLDLFSFVMVIITIWTAGLAGGFLAVIQQLAINYLLIELVLFVAELTGSAELAAVVGIVATIALGSAGAMPAFDFTSATDLVNISTKFADNLSMLYNEEAQLIAEDLRELNKEAKDTLDEMAEYEKNLGSRIDTAWLASLQSATTSYYTALEAQYDFDQIYSYDRLVANYVDNELRNGVV